MEMLKHADEAYGTKGLNWLISFLDFPIGFLLLPGDSVAKMSLPFIPCHFV